MVFAALSTTVLGSQQRVSIQTLTEFARHCGQMSTLSFTLVFTMFLFLLVTREISDFVCFQILQAYYLMINMFLGNLRFKTKNQDLLRSLWGILVLGFGSEIPRFVQESWGNLGYWFLVLAENAFWMHSSHSECVLPRVLSLKLRSISLNSILIILLLYIYIIPLACM